MRRNGLTPGFRMQTKLTEVEVLQLMWLRVSHSYSNHALRAFVRAGLQHVVTGDHKEERRSGLRIEPARLTSNQADASML